MCQCIYAQGVTTGSIRGTVQDAKTKKALTGATIVALHVPSGSKYGAVSRKNGSFVIRGMRIGQGYRFTTTFIGYAPSVRENVSISLGENDDFTVLLSEVQTTTSEVVVSAKQDELFHQSKNGSGSTVTEAEIQAAPSINRSLADVARVNPYTSQTTNYGGDDGLQGVSVAGMNSRYNNIQIDGAVANDMFGLGQAGTAGSQANANTISLDAVQELQVNVSPYDVKQSGFTGALINAVTRSGSNRTTGSVFAYGRNATLVGRSPDASHSLYPSFKDFQFGGRVGGAIVQNKLFYHVTVETRQRTRPLDLGINNPSAINNFPHTLSEINEVASIAKDRFGYDAGNSDLFMSRNNTYNVLGRIDWNIEQNNKIQLRYNYTNAFQDRNVQRTPTVFSLSSQWNEFRSVNHSGVLQWNSLLSEDVANEARITYTQTSDARVLQSSPFAQVKVWLNATDYVLLGPERNSHANSLDQTQVAFTDDLSFNFDEHNLSVGTHTEWYRFNNLFIPDYYGYYVFPTVNAFRDSTPSYYALSYADTSVTGGNVQPRALWSMMQTGLYVQDEWKVSSILNVKVGLRADVPIYLDYPVDNPKFDSSFHALAQQYNALPDSLKGSYSYIPDNLGTSKLPKTSILWSPRIGFNADLSNGEKRLQLRGGTGLFNGKVAAVWLSNQFSNTGVEFDRIAVGSDASTGSALLGLDGKTPIRVSLNPNAPPKPGDGSFAGASDRTTAINVMSRDFTPPQVWRSTLGFDWRISKDLSLSTELMYSKTFNNVDYANLNLRRSLRLANSPVDGRPLYALNPSRTSADSNNSRDYTQVLYLSSRDEGYQYSSMLSLKLNDRNEYVPGLSVLISYVHSAAYDLQAATAATAQSNWQNTYSTDPNNVALGRSNFDVPHRFTMNISYALKLFNRAPTMLNLFYSASSGQPYSFVFQGDANGDGIAFNDLIYVPAPEDYNTRVTVVPTGGIDLRTAPQIWAQLMSFIDANPTLKKYQGQVLPRNEMRAPFIHQVDLRLSQAMPIETLKNLHLTLDIQNLLNLLDKDLGLQQYLSFQSYSLVELKTDNTNSVYDAQGRLRINFSTPTVNGRPGVYTTDSFYSRWRMQLGLRYNF